MIVEFSALTVLHGICAVVYAVLTALLVARRPVSPTAVWLAAACGATGLWAGGVAAFVFSVTAVLGVDILQTLLWYVATVVVGLGRRSNFDDGRGLKSLSGFRWRDNRGNSTTTRRI